MADAIDKKISELDEIVDVTGDEMLVVAHQGENKKVSVGNVRKGLATEEWVENKLTEDNSNGFEYVDFGLPSGLLWATCNVGASKPEEYGLYFAWGETRGYTNASAKSGGFAWATSPYWVSGTSPANTKWSKYTATDKYSSDGKADNKLVLEPEDDAVKANIGGTWRMPTSSDFQELIDNTDPGNGANSNGWITDYKGTGVMGMLRKGKGQYADREIFFPAAGFADGASMGGGMTNGLYWSSSLNTSTSYSAYHLNFYSSSVNPQSSINRYRGHSIRGVIENTKSPKYLTKKDADETYEPKLPDGTQGQVLTKTEKGVAWEDAKGGDAKVDFAIRKGTGTNAISANATGNIASGNNSFASGFGTTASGGASHAEGASTTAGGDRSHAEGGSTTALQRWSHAEGYMTTADGDGAHAEGQLCHAADSCAHAEGSNTYASANAHSEGAHTKATGGASHAEGSDTIASGTRSHAEGGGTNATGSWSHSEGYNTIASGSPSHAEGQGSRAEGTASHAEGEQTLSKGMYSHAEGHGAYAYGNKSHAEGFDTYAEGICSHAEGQYTAAKGDISHAEGANTIAYNDGEHASGMHNVSVKEEDTEWGDSRNTLFSVGNGIRNGNEQLWNPANGPQEELVKRHNAFEIKQSGDIYIPDTSADGEYYEKPMLHLQEKLKEIESSLTSDLTQITTLAGRVESNGLYFTAPIAINDLVMNRSVTRKTAASNGKIPNCIHFVLNVGDYTVQVACPLYEVILDTDSVVAVTYEGTKINYDGVNYILSALCQREEDAIKASVSLTEPKS